MYYLLENHDIVNSEAAKLPVWSFNDLVKDIVNDNGTLYCVTVDHKKINVGRVVKESLSIFDVLCDGVKVLVKGSSRNPLTSTKDNWSMTYLSGKTKEWFTLKSIEGTDKLWVETVVEDKETSYKREDWGSNTTCDGGQPTGPTVDERYGIGCAYSHSDRITTNGESWNTGACSGQGPELSETRECCVAGVSDTGTVGSEAHRSNTNTVGTDYYKTYPSTRGSNHDGSTSCSVGGLSIKKYKKVICTLDDIRRDIVEIKDVKGQTVFLNGMVSFNNLSY